MRRFLVASVVGMSMLALSRAHADPSPHDDARATTELFKEARALVEAGNVAEACPKTVRVGWLARWSSLPPLRRAVFGSTQAA
jgi:hypothetical protein